MAFSKECRVSKLRTKMQENINLWAIFYIYYNGKVEKLYVFDMQETIVYANITIHANLRTQRLFVVIYGALKSIYETVDV